MSTHLRERIAHALADQVSTSDTIDALVPLVTAELDERDARIRELEAEIDRADLRADLRAQNKRIRELEEENARLQRLLAQTRRDKWAARWDAAELQAHLDTDAATALTRHDQAHGHYEEGK